jgi:hypothetical protein
MKIKHEKDSPAFSYSENENAASEVLPSALHSPEINGSHFFSPLSPQQREILLPLKEQLNLI